MNLNNLSLQEIADKISWPLDRWAGNCYAIALALVNAGLVKGKARYGHYRGPVAPGTMFHRASVTGFVQHGWVELPDGSVVDPTRWVFEGAEPYIYNGPADHYDVGGSTFRDQMRAINGPPAYDPLDKQFELQGLPSDMIRLLRTICQDPRPHALGRNIFSKAQMFWLANANPKELGRWCRKFYQLLEQNKMSAFVPQDYWHLVMEEEVGYE